MATDGPRDVVIELIRFRLDEAESARRAFTGRCGQFIFCSSVCSYGDTQIGRGELAREVMHSKIGSVRAQPFDRDSELDRLQKRVGRRLRLRVRGRCPVAEGEETMLFRELLISPSP